MTDLNDWAKSELGKICSIEIGGTPSRNNPDYWDLDKSTDNYWVSIRDLNKKLIATTSEHLTDLGVKNSNVKLQRKGTVLLSFKLSIGRIAFAGQDLYTNEAIAGLSTNLIDNNYLYYGLQQWDLLKGVDQAIKGATLNKEKLKNIEVFYPQSRKEQQKIAEVLSCLDKAIEQTEAIIAKQQRVKTGLMQDLLTKGVDEKGNIRSEETHDFKDSSLGRIPISWDIDTLGKGVAKGGGSVQTGPFGSQLHAEDYKNEGVPIITVEHLGDNEIIHANLPLVGEDDYIRLNKYLLQLGDLVFSRVGSIDRCSYVSESENGWLFSGRCLRVRCGSLLDSKFLSYQLNFDKARNWILNNSVGTTMPCLNTTILSAVPIFIPSHQEQLQISHLINKILLVIQKEKESLLKFKKIKTGLMQDLLTGKVRVNHLIN